ncbi:CRISPR-associated protein Cas4 [Pleurocapsa sp. PCC 7319]|uniref:CRISPR-associated protein Cas4 n=1 Tax=Pleurocapsa sp. PCC 7319 TaxID=118161 RepID=UPI000349352B|nr:CRISPR-associated protein Cas4 [Pleurocapsa sp. PCC 7319]
MNKEENYVPIAALNHYAYCPHRCWRMFCAGDFIDNHYTIEGTSLHDRVHTLSQENYEDTWQVRAIWLKSEKYGLVGKSDLIESNSGELYPIEYKRGKRDDWENDALQVCGQALCLEEMTGKNIGTGYVYYAHSHQRQPVNIDRNLREKAIATISDIQAMMQTGKMPPPVYKPRCKDCSLYTRCLPQAVNKVKRYKE